jgi:hypothetical protein
VTRIAAAVANDTVENPRAVIGSNRPPIDEQVVIDLAEALVAEGLTKRIEDLLASFGRAPEITSPEIAGRYAEIIKQMVAAQKAVEAEREKLNRPLLTAQRALKGRADAITAPLKEAETVARARLKKFDDHIAELERQREAEAQRIAEQERQRLQAIADQEAQKERDRLQAIENERAAAEAREAAVVEVQAETVEVAVEVTTNAGPIAQGDFGAKVSRTTTWKHEIISVRQLPDSILKHAKVVEAIDKVIAAQVRSGTREMKGVRIFAETGIAIR